MNEINRIIGINIKRAREANGLKQDVLARGLKCSKPAISMMESGQIDFSISRIEKIASILNVDTFSLFSASKQTININSNRNHASPDLISEIITELCNRLSR